MAENIEPNARRARDRKVEVYFVESIVGEIGRAVTVTVMNPYGFVRVNGLTLWAKADEEVRAGAELNPDLITFKWLAE